MGKFTILKKAPGNYFFVLKLDSNQNVLQSELYSTKQSCLNGIKSVKNNSTDLTNFVQKITSNGKNYFILKARNGEVIGFSSTYDSLFQAQNGVQMVHSIANKAYIVDRTI